MQPRGSKLEDTIGDESGKSSGQRGSSVKQAYSECQLAPSVEGREVVYDARESDQSANRHRFITYNGDSHIPVRNLKAKRAPKFFATAIRMEQMPCPSIMSGMIRAAENLFATTLYVIHVTILL